MRNACTWVVFFFILCQQATAQSCTTLGQNPESAFPVCGITSFQQVSVPICGDRSITVPGCNDGALYQNKNPFWYKFTCYQSGTLGFTITPTNLNDDYDWQLWDITGHNPGDVFTDPTLFVIANWAGTFGVTGASASGTSVVQCASDPAANLPTFSKMPNILQGHTYLLLVSHFTDSQIGYSLAFGGGTGVITDPLLPQFVSAKADCDGKNITVKLNKRMKCNSITPTGSEFSIPGGPAVISALPDSCSLAFDFQSFTVTLAAPLTNGTYSLVIKNGVDANTLLDNCDQGIALNASVPFTYNLPQPIFADSVGRVGCAPTELKVYFPKRIDCATIAPDGSDFSISGPSAVTVLSANGNCVNGRSDMITVKLASPVSAKGLYTLTLKAGSDGNVAIDECGIALPSHSRTFTAVDTVSAEFSYIPQLDCRFNSVAFSHDGAHDVNNWRWTFNNTSNAGTQQCSTVFPATSNNSIQLMVTNGVCSDTVIKSLAFDNEVKAAFEMASVICPEDPLQLTNTSTGLIDTWQWKFGINNVTSAVKSPAPVQFPTDNIEHYYTILLKATNTTLNCTDSVSQKVRVLNNCFIAVPSAFTPNNDGINDFLYPNNAVKAENLEFRVFNRWGQQVFLSHEWTRKWDGKINGIPQSPGVFVWFLSYTIAGTDKKVFQKGTTTLIR